MKVTETITRECCQPKDLKPLGGTALVGRDPEWKFCTYCGHRHKYNRFTDAAGSSDWEYIKEEK